MKERTERVNLKKSSFKKIDEIDNSQDYSNDISNLFQSDIQQNSKKNEQVTISNITTSKINKRRSTSKIKFLLII